MSNELTLLPDMTLEEAKAKHAQLKSLESVMRSLLLEMRDRKGWQALGFSSWAEYGEKEWNYSLSQLDRLATAARIENFLPPMGGLQIPERHLRPLSKVDDADKSAVWQEAIDRALAESKKIGAKHVEGAVNEWKSKNEALQSDLLDTKKSLKNYRIMYSESSKQRDELRDNQQQIIDARVNEEKAKMILENQEAIAQVKRERDTLKQFERVLCHTN